MDGPSPSTRRVVTPKPFLRRGEGVEKRVFASRYRPPPSARPSDGGGGDGAVGSDVGAGSRATDQHRSGGEGGDRGGGDEDSSTDGQRQQHRAADSRAGTDHRFRVLDAEPDDGGGGDAELEAETQLLTAYRGGWVGGCRMGLAHAVHLAC